MIWRVQVVSICPIAELEEIVFYDFYDDLTAWRFFELMSKSVNYISVSKPFNPYCYGK